VQSVAVQCLSGAWRSRVLAGSGLGRTTDGIGATADFSAPGGSVLLPSGMVLIAEVAGSVIRRVTPGNGLVTTYSGAPLPGYLDSSVTRSAAYRAPQGMAIDRSGNVYIADSGNHVIRRIDAFSGAVTTLAGSGQAGLQDGIGSVAQFNSPRAVAVDAAGNVYVADTGNHVIRRISPDAVVTTFAGTARKAGFVNGVAGLAQFNAPAGITVDASGQIYVSDSQNGAIRLLTQAGLVTTLAGNGTQGDADGVGSGARFSNPTALIVDPQYLLYVADSGNHKVKTVQIVGGVGTVQTLAGTGHPGDADGESLSIGLRQPLGLTMTVGGELVVSEAAGNRLRLLSRAVLR
jgi:streptogramin lyase